VLGRCVSWKTLVDDLFVGAGVLAGRSPKKSRSLVGHRFFVCLLEKEGGSLVNYCAFLATGFFLYASHPRHIQSITGERGRSGNQNTKAVRYFGVVDTSHCCYGYISSTNIYIYSNNLSIILIFVLYSVIKRILKTRIWLAVRCTLLFIIILAVVYIIPQSLVQLRTMVLPSTLDCFVRMARWT